MIKGIIFDLDGTLVNTLADLTTSLNLALKDNKIDKIYSKEEVRLMIGHGIGNLCASAIPSNILSEEVINKVHSSFKLNYKIHELDESIPYPMVKETLMMLKNQKIKLGVISNKRDENVQKIISTLFGDDLFDLVLGHTDKFKLKPDPESSNYIIEQLGLTKEEVIYVGDSDVDIITASNTKVKCIAVSYGYRDKETLEKYHPDYLIDNFQDINEIIRKS